MSNLNEEDIARYQEGIKIVDYRIDELGYWEGLHDDGTIERDWRPVYCHEVPVKYLLETYHCMVVELSRKETEYMELKEQYNSEEFEIVYMSDINFKELYGSTSKKVRKQHASTVLKPLKTKLNGLELSIDYLKRYIVFIRELCKWKRTIMERKQ